jgi:hypothetical protein
MLGPALLLAVSLAPPPVRGIALGLYSEDPGFSYAPLLHEIAQTGANAVELVVNLYQDDGASDRIFRHTRFSPTDSALREAARAAQAEGLAVTLLPIVRLAHPAAGEWRGTLHPASPTAWWKSYGSHLIALARLAEELHLSSLVIGSELGSLDGPPHVERWRALAAQVRHAFSGTLLYAANWDHYETVAPGLWDLVDAIGLSAYFELAPRGRQGEAPSRMAARLREVRRALEAFATARHGKRILLTEVGYLSQRGAAAWPWKEDAADPVDLEEQRRCYRVFVSVWDGAPSLEGVFFWNWYGFGGDRSRGYTPRGKPAAQEILRWFGGGTATDRSTPSSTAR